ncbi:MAG: Epoxyqueuosine reductase [Alphaproteobacteria bacterium MarineAlpha9_Bin5]|nr:MAG: Epoxyqueuosine reductase [Alphaproteobacteria bacterium MarineAlpha9_Bin5]HIM71739.1 tRNA epoxyqueuosine(34) reductase QueG [Alphaproteobacteria bacterium]
MTLVSKIRDRALSLGFDAIGFADPEDVGQAGRKLSEFIALGRHGEMKWMTKKLDRRKDPKKLWPAVRGVIVVAANYGPETDPLDDLSRRSIGTISVYARNRDYHKILKGRLKQLGNWMSSSLGGKIKVFVDTAPVMEKPLAEAAGLGWQGKHTNLVSQEYGSWLFLGVIFTTFEVSSEETIGDRCGSCQRCLDICPTHAFPAPYQLDARRCISYLTIEHKGQIAREFRSAMGNRIFGCDDCLAVCPWNKFARATREVKLSAREDLLAPDLSMLARLDDQAFRTLFAGSPIKRLGRNRFVRNVLVAIGNSANPALAKAAAARLEDSSPLVRGMAVWAWQQLAKPEEIAGRRKQHLCQESDSAVRAEWGRELPTGEVE